MGFIVQKIDKEERLVYNVPSSFLEVSIMFESYLRLLDTLKRERFSETVVSIRDKVLGFLKSEKMSPLIQQYLATYQTSGIPFTDFDTEPAQISQIKKLINASHHIEVALRKLESIDLRTGDRKIFDMWMLYNVVSDIYQGSYLITHCDINLRNIFQDEFDKLYHIGNKVSAFAKKHDLIFDNFTGAVDSLKLTEIERAKTFASQAGQISSKVVDQLKPHTGQLDVRLIAQFSAELPEILESLATKIKGYTDSLSEGESKLTRSKLEELQNHALVLLYSVEKLRGSSIFLSFKAIYYIRILSKIVALSSSVFESFGVVNETSQGLIAEKLDMIKYELFPELMGVVDKLEEESMISPGTFANPLKGALTRLYGTITYYANKFVDLELKRKDLLVLEDDKYKNLRTDKVHANIASLKIEHIKTQNLTASVQAFFKVLKKPKYKNLALINLPPKKKQKLLRIYKRVRALFENQNMELDNAIVHSLTQNAPSKLQSILNFFSKPKDAISTILPYEDKILQKLTKDKATLKFKRKLYRDIVESFHTGSTEEPLKTCKTNPTLLKINESDLLADVDKKDLDLQNLTGALTLKSSKSLNSSQLSTILQKYLQEEEKLELLVKRFNELSQLLSKNKNQDLANFSATEKAELTNLYKLVQPYLFNIFSKINNVNVADIDARITAVLAANKNASLDKDDILSLSAFFNSEMNQNLQQIRSRKKTLKTWYTLQLNAENEHEALAPSTADLKRAHHLFKNTNFSTKVNQYRLEVMGYMKYLNDAVRSQLKPAEHGVPYPEVELHENTLGQSSQVFIIKGLINSIYYLEQIGVALESLRDDSSQFDYVKKVIRAGSYLNDAYSLIKAMYKDPYFSVTAGGFMDCLTQFRRTLQEVSEPYMLELPEYPREERTEHNTVTAYIFNTIFMMPEHIKAWNNNTKITPALESKIKKHAEATSDKMQAVVNSANSYFKLFFHFPNIISLYTEIKKKFFTLTELANKTVVDNLEEIRDVAFTNLLLEVDKIEDTLGLKPGIVGDTTQMLLRIYYQGLLEHLGLDSKKHIELISSTKPIDLRIEAVEKRIAEAKLERDSVFQNKQKFEYLQQALHAYIEAQNNRHNLSKAQAKSWLLSAATEVMDLIKKLHEIYEDAHLPLIIKDVTELEEIFADTLNWENKLNAFGELVKLSIYHYKGLVSSHDLMINTSSEKVLHLEEVKKKHEEELVPEFIESYKEEKFISHVESLVNIPYGLSGCEDEYAEKLKEFLLQKKEDILKTASQSADLKATIEDLVKKNIAIFERENYLDYYRLDKIYRAVQHFKSYSSNVWKAQEEGRDPFESKETLTEKLTIVNRIHKTIEAKDVNVKQRIKQISDVVSKRTFATTMLNTRSFDKYSFAWLKNWILSLFTALQLHKPRHARCYNSFAKSVKETPDVHSIRKKYGLFSTSLDDKDDVKNNKFADKATSNQVILAAH